MKNEKSNAPEIRNLVVVSDLHSGCQFGLCPPNPQPKDGGGYYIPSNLQIKVWDWWASFWRDWVPMVTRNEPFAVLINGDSTDGVHHNSTTQISHNLNDQKEIARRILEPIVAQCSGNFNMIRGTEAHVGQSGQNEEILAKELGAIPQDLNAGDISEIQRLFPNTTPEKNLNYARWLMWIEMGEGLIHATHHIGTTGSTAYESSAPMSELANAFSEAGRWDERAPDVIIRSHRHRAIQVEVPTRTGYGICSVTPGWQLKTPLIHRIAGGRMTTPQFGGLIVKAGDEDPIYVRSKIWNIERTPSVKL